MTDPALDPAQGIKPLDFGEMGVNGSVDAYGRLIALNTFHAQHGYVTLTTADPFPRDQWRDQAAVRAYRAGLATLRGFGPDVEVASSEAFLLDGAIPCVRLELVDGARAEVTTLAHTGGAIQRWQIDGAIPRWRGQLSVQRCAYAQLTEGGPIPMLPVQTHATFEAGTLTLENPALGQAAAISGFAAGEPWATRADGPVEIDLPGADGTTTLVFGFGMMPRRPAPQRMIWRTRMSGTFWTISAAGGANGWTIPPPHTRIGGGWSTGWRWPCPSEIPPAS
jgi:hypothetical protein